MERQNYLSVPQESNIVLLLRWKHWWGSTYTVSAQHACCGHRLAVLSLAVVVRH